MRFVIEGPPRTKKNHQRIMRGRGGRPFVAQAKTATAWEATAILQLRSQWATWSRAWIGTHAPLDVPTNLRALVYRDRAVGDLGNFLSAVCDALERAGVMQNDRLILGFDGSRLLVDRARPRIEIELTPLLDKHGRG